MNLRLLKYSLVDHAFLSNLIQENAKIKAQISEATNFIKDIENGKLDREYKKEDSSDNQLSAALMSMQDQLKKISEEEKNRNWATEGLAKFADILRGNTDNINHFGDSIISSLVKYLNANQGGLFVLNEEDPNEIHLELIACYAYNRKKFLERKIAIGEGLVGQTFLEKETIYMTELPKNYTTITSGLGDATPGSIILIPLKINDNVLGVIEIASFDVMEKFKVDFLEKVAESIASALTAVRVASRTERLLRESQIQTEQLRSQEEEVRQNMEELSATQEEMHRVLKDAQKQEQYLNELINVPKDSIFTLDRDMKLISFNRSFSGILETMGIPVTKGFDFLQLFPDEKDKKKQRDLYARAFNGESFEQTDEYETNGVMAYYMAHYAPLYNEDREVIAVASFSKDVTPLITAQKDSQKQEQYLNELINVPKDSIFTLDKDMKLISFNRSFSGILETMGIPVAKGFDFMQLFPDEKEKNKQRLIYERAFKGESFEQMDEYEAEGVTSYYLGNYAPLYNKEGEVIAVACFSKDISALINAQKETEQLLMQSKQQTEELRAQEEEMRQNMEELSAVQEEMQRLFEESKAKETYMQSFLNASEDALLAVDKDLNMQIFNTRLADFFNGLGGNVQKGKNIADLLNPVNKEEQLDVYRRTLKGEKFDLIKQYADLLLEIKYNPIKDDKGEIIGVCCFTRDITDFEKQHPDVKAEVNKIK